MSDFTTEQLVEFSKEETAIVLNRILDKIVMLDSLSIAEKLSVTGIIKKELK